MAEQRVRLECITIAAADVERTAGFYEQVLGAQFQAVDLDGFALRVGQVAGLRLQVCPKELAGISATENLCQLRFVVPSLERCRTAAVAAGGGLLGEVVSQGGRTIGAVRDPDGSSVELVELDS